MKHVSSFLIIALALTLAGCALARERHESAVFVVDVSGTIVDVGAMVQAKRIVADLNERFPDYVESAGLMYFGGLHVNQQDWLADVSDYRRDEIARAAGSLVGTEGPTPIGAALRKSDEGLDLARGKTALILVSDGIDNGYSDPVATMRALKKKHGADLCVFPIQVGMEAEGEALLNELVGAAGCGKSTYASKLKSDGQLQALVDYIFPPSSPAPPPPPVIKDSDGDGVMDPDDMCPGTPLGAPVDYRGCWVLSKVKFDFDKFDIKPQYAPYLDEVLVVLRNNPGLKIVVEGHTDSEGEDEYNNKLSQKRADTVMDYFVSKGIDASRLSAVGYGETRPAASNDTPEGMADNRRIELGVIQ